MRVYNRYGRRDNKYKARIKILVTETGIDEFRSQVAAEYATLENDKIAVSQEEIDRIASYFAAPDFEDIPDNSAILDAKLSKDNDFFEWVKTNTMEHKASGYAIVNISLKPFDVAPGDITSEQMRAISDIADSLSLIHISEPTRPY